MACDAIKTKGLTNEVKAEAKLLLRICRNNALIMLYKGGTRRSQFTVY
jgi:hypothetical protein